MERARKRLRTEWFRTARDPGALAFEIGHFATMDRWTTLAEHLEARETVTPADVRRLVRRYFTSENRVTGVARPGDDR